MNHNIEGPGGSNQTPLRIFRVEGQVKTGNRPAMLNKRHLNTAK